MVMMMMPRRSNDADKISLQAMEQAHPQQPKAPYPPQTAGVGGTPTVHTDVPISAVFMFMFIVGAVTHMTILQLNRRKSHKFLMSGLIFGFCMARITTMIMRIAWASHPTHVPLAIAAMVFVSAGVVLLFVVNLIFAQRIVRACYPHFGWHVLASRIFMAIYVLIILTLVMLIIATVQSFYTLSANTQRIDRGIQRYGSSWYAFVAFLPILIVFIGLVLPRRTRVEKFGIGRFRTKIRILLIAAVLLSLGAFFRAGTGYRTPRPRNHPAWYHSRACFYLFNFGVEILVVYLYAILRVDLRFHVPNGSSGPGDYVAGRATADAGADAVAGNAKEKPILARVHSEEEVFDDEPVDYLGDPLKHQPPPNHHTMSSNDKENARFASHHAR